MRNYSFRIFHSLIIASLLFSLFGCGYKGPPVYDDGNSTKITTPKKKNAF